MVPRNNMGGGVVAIHAVAVITRTHDIPESHVSLSVQHTILKYEYYAPRNSMVLYVSTWLAPPKGGLPASISNRIAPTLHRSAFAPYLCPWRISGACAERQRERERGRQRGARHKTKR